jgi:L-ribulose-5-phosphate 3-epimerase
MGTMSIQSRESDRGRQFDRRRFLGQAALATALGPAAGAVLGGLNGHAASDPAAPGPAPRRNPIRVSTYSFRQFRDRDRDRRPSMAQIIDQAAMMGFDGVEILHVQM